MGEFLAGLEAHDAERMAALIAEDAVVELPYGPRPRHEALAAIRALWSRLPTLLPRFVMSEAFCPPEA